MTQVVTASSLTFVGKGDFAALELHELAVQLLKRLVAEAGADVTDIAPAVLLAHRKDKRSKERRVRLGAVNPAMTTSWRFEVLIFSQSSVRAPDRYLLSARLAMMPSRPLRSASSKNLLPHCFAVTAERDADCGAAGCP